jgi:hypothetical protein
MVWRAPSAASSCRCWWGSLSGRRRVPGKSIRYPAFFLPCGVLERISLKIIHRVEGRVPFPSLRLLGPGLQRFIWVIGGMKLLRTVSCCFLHTAILCVVANLVNRAGSPSPLLAMAETKKMTCRLIDQGLAPGSCLGKVGLKTPISGVVPSTYHFSKLRMPCI